MKEEIWKLKGQLATYERDLEKFSILANNAIITVRDKLNPSNIDNDFLDLPITTATIEMEQLDEIYKKAKELKEKIHRIRKELEETKGAL
jgi:hypothetical protein